MPQLAKIQIATLKSGAAHIADPKRRKVVELALDLEGDRQITWQGGGNLSTFLDNSKSDRTPKTGKYISLVCWLWPIYVAWRCKVAKDKHLKDYTMMGAAERPSRPGTRRPRGACRNRPGRPVARRTGEGGPARQPSLSPACQIRRLGTGWAAKPSG